MIFLIALVLIQVSCYEYNLFNKVGLLSQPQYQSGVGTVSAHFGAINSIVIDSGGNIFVADSVLNVIRKILTTGATSIFVGSPAFRSGATEGGIGTFAQVNNPQGMVIQPVTQEIFLTGSNRIRKVTTTGVIRTIIGTGGGGFRLGSLIITV